MDDTHPHDIAVADSNLPDPPSFEPFSAPTRGLQERRMRIFATIGNLVLNWSNNESLFVHVLMLLMETDHPTSVIVFGTLNTTRARLDLVNRLAKAKLRDEAIARRLKLLVKRFEAATKLRNELNHSMFAVDQLGEITHTNLMRIEEKRGRICFGRERPLDDRRLEEMNETAREMTELNRDIWQFLPELERHLRANRRKDSGGRPPSADK
ncbi:hypothetical protein J2R99_002010 [Rhodopseudomonas julia]|uniref:Uncharacterized protein n=1 Tax=Rhodopseudomonas julia TaxID=200617 RepID=A0ABU0C6J0_9BRAD|nr:hypothetical protein [Rhodopseudomonas julia]MDQ0326141.1 hypothetical protein [Rhodopseudomonas julia]